MSVEDARRMQRHRLAVFTATWFSYAGFYVARKVYAVVKHPLKVQFGFSDEQVAAPWTTYLVAYMLGQFLAAWLGQRMPSKRVLAYGMVVAAACDLALGLMVDAHLASVFLWMCVTMGIHGLSQATGWPHNVALVANWTHRAERGTLFGIWGTCYQLGAVAGKALAGFLLGWLGIAWSFYGASLVLFAVTVLFLLLAEERPESVGLSLHEVPAATGARDATQTEQAPLTRSFVLLVLSMGGIYFGLKFLRYALDSWSALILTETFHVAEDRAAYLSTVFDWVGLLGVIAAGWLSDRLPGARRTPVIFYMTFGCLAATAALWLVGLSSTGMFVVLLGVIGFMQLGPDSLLAGACAMDVGSRRRAALAAGVINGCGSTGPILQEPLIAWVKQTAGVPAVFLLLLLVGAVTTTSTWFLMRFERRRGRL